MTATGRDVLRRASLLDAAIAEIGEKRSADVTVGDIARRAGVSSALAHHYFGTKRNLIVAAMRRVLSIYGEEVRDELRSATSPIERIDAIVRASFAASNFRPDTVRTWLVLYPLAQTDAAAARLLVVYRRRLRSNLCHALRPLVGERSREVADLAAAMIDGFYIRRVLDDEAQVVSPDRAILTALRQLIEARA